MTAGTDAQPIKVAAAMIATDVQSANEVVKEAPKKRTRRKKDADA